MAKFRMRKKPERPKRRTDVPFSIDVGSGRTFQELLDKVEDYCDRHCLDFADILVSHYYECVNLEGVRVETNAEYAARLQEYEDKLKKYNSWYANNKENAEKYLEAKEAQKRSKLKRQAENMQKELASIEARLKEME